MQGAPAKSLSRASNYSGPALTEVAWLRSTFNGVKHRIHQANITFHLYHPAHLVFMLDSQKVSFTEPSEALSFINHHAPATSGDSTSAGDT